MDADRERAKQRRILVRQAAAGEKAVDAALAALKSVDPADYPAYMIAKLLEVGAAVTMSALAALRDLNAEGRGEDDPWERIARELSAEPEPVRPPSEPPGSPRRW